MREVGPTLKNDGWGTRLRQKPDSSVAAATSNESGLRVAERAPRRAGKAQGPRPGLQTRRDSSRFGSAWVPTKPVLDPRRSGKTGSGHPLKAGADNWESR